MIYGEVAQLQIVDGRHSLLRECFRNFAHMCVLWELALTPTIPLHSPSYIIHAADSELHSSCFKQPGNCIWM